MLPMLAHMEFAVASEIAAAEGLTQFAQNPDLPTVESIPELPDLLPAPPPRGVDHTAAASCRGAFAAQRAP